MRLRLRFKDPELEERFLKHFYEDIAKSTGYVAIVGTAILATFCLVDQIFALTLRARLLELAMCLTIGALTFACARIAKMPDPRRRIVSALVTVIFIVFAFFATEIFEEAAQRGEFNVAGYGANLLIIFGAAVVVQERAIWNFLYGLSFALMTLWRLSGAERLTPLDIKTFSAHFVFASFLGGMASWIRERWYRSNFLLKNEIEIEKLRGDSLINTMLPAAVASRLVHKKESFAETYPDVTVLFADLVGFSKWAARSHPQELVRLLNEMFKAFDQAVEAEGGEKIKTIGDAYMVAVGCPTRRADHAMVAMHLSVAMRRAAKQLFFRERAQLDLRIGVHSGMVVAGVLGEAKPTFDIWGDTVNIAARLENAAAPGAILVSESTWELTRGQFSFAAGVQKDLKGIGTVSTYELKRAV